MKRLILCSAIALSVSACATKPPRADQLKAAPTEHLTAFQSPKDGDATLIVTRDIGMLGGGCYMALFVDGRDVGKLATGETATFHLPAGEHIVGTWITGSGLCGFREGADRTESSTIIRRGETRKFRIAALSGGGYSITPTTI
ncbi:hypothetical protein QFZ41_003666 [Luteibacter sp. W1I16]|uniref:hypothetical protein n=1 Tax=Luteibacter sp. W1I16 TaxID=3373922 RepID=UPI003D1CC46B